VLNLRGNLLSNISLKDNDLTSLQSLILEFNTLTSFD
jgi:hypothetical protein